MLNLIFLSQAPIGPTTFRLPSYAIAFIIYYLLCLPGSMYTALALYHVSDSMFYFK